MLLGSILFLILALIAVVAAIGMLTSTNAVHAALFLVINFACIALFYLGLNAPFLAMVQITVYAGAIMVLFLFVIMLLGAESVELGSRLRWQAPLGLLLVIALIVTAAIVMFSPGVQGHLAPVGPGDQTLHAEDAPDYDYGGPHSVGDRLFNAYLLPFELTGVLLLVAMVGAIVLAKEERRVLVRKGQLASGVTQEPAELPAGADK